MSEVVDYMQALNAPMLVAKPAGRSEKIGELVAALAKAQLKFKPIVKNVKNSYFNSWYADLGSVIEATQESLAENGLVVFHDFLSNPSAKEIEVRTYLYHSSDQFTSNSVIMPGIGDGRDGKEKYNAQTISSAVTYARRIGYQSITGVTGEQDDDGNAASGNDTRSETPTPRPPVRQPAPQKPVAAPKAEIPAETTTISENSNIPSPEKFKGYMEWCSELGKDLSNNHGLSNSIGRPSGKKLLTYIMKVTQANDPKLKDVTTAKWDFLQDLVASMKTSEGGYKKLVELIEAGGEATS